MKIIIAIVINFFLCYDLLIFNLFIDCSSQCLTCEGSDTNCLTCNGDRLLPSCQCDSQYYDLSKSTSVDCIEL